MTVCEIVRGISGRMVDEFKVSMFFSESELELDGIVQMYIDGTQDAEFYALEAFVNGRLDDYRQFLLEQAGITVPKMTKPAMMTYLEEKGLWDEYAMFCSGNSGRWNGAYRKDEVRQMILDDRLAPLLEKMGIGNIYVYRDSDHWGIHVFRTSD